MTQPAPEQTSLWEFALWLYAQPEVAIQCVKVQDDYGIDVVRLLWLAWLDWRAQAPSTQAVAASIPMCAHWQAQVVQPLRAVRRQLKLPQSPFTRETVDPLRTQVKAVELEAERLLLVQLEGLITPEERLSMRGEFWHTTLSDYLKACALPAAERAALTCRLLPWRQPAPLL